MIVDFLKFIWKNIGTLLIAFFLALIIWIFAAISSDPNQDLVYPNDISLNIIGINENLVFVGEIPDDIITTLRAPNSVWEKLLEGQEFVSANIDLTGFEVGSYQLPINIIVGIEPVRIVEIFPEEISFSLEELKAIDKIIGINIIGEPALGYQLEGINLSEKIVNISGPESVIDKIDSVIANINVSESRGDSTFETELQILDTDGLILTGLNISPSIIVAEQLVSLVFGQRNLVVIPQTVGDQQSGYKVTSISVYPQTVLVSSSDPQLVNNMPGFVRTQALDLTNANDDIEVHLLLELPEGVVIESEEQSMLVQVGIAYIESSIILKLPIETINLDSGLAAELSPLEVELFLSGPVPILDQLSIENIVIVVDLMELTVGTHLVAPTVVTIHERILIDAISPEFIEVTIVNSEEGSTVNNPGSTP